MLRLCAAAQTPLAGAARTRLPAAVSSTTLASPPRRYATSFIDPSNGLTPEQREYLSVAQGFAATQLAPHAAQWDADKTFPADALRAAAALGFGGLYVSPDHGGSGLSRSDSMPIIEALATADVRCVTRGRDGRRPMPGVVSARTWCYSHPRGTNTCAPSGAAPRWRRAPLAPRLVGAAATSAAPIRALPPPPPPACSTTAYLTIHNMCGWIIDTFGTPEQKAAWLPDLCSMRRFASYCLTEPGAGSDASSLATRAERSADGSHFTLNGSKAFISGGGRSDAYLVMARTGGPGAGGISCFLVEAGTPGLSFGAQEKKVGWNSQPTAAVFFDNVVLPASALVGSEGGGFKIAMRGLNGGRLSIAACSLGGAHACLTAAVAYTKGRRQFGQPLSALQHTQFTLADMAMGLHSARLAMRHAAGALDVGDPHAPVYCAIAKKSATDVGFAVTDAAMQLVRGREGGGGVAGLLLGGRRGSPNTCALTTVAPPLRHGAPLPR